MDGMACLVEEHKRITAAMQLIKTECQQILAGKPVDGEFHRHLIQFCRFFADRHHHGKEEKILFRIMMDALGPLAEKLIRGGMLVEHDLGRYHVGEWEKALLDYEKTSSLSAKLEVLTNASEYASLLLRHIAKEDAVVYAFAKRELTAELLQKVDEETAVFEEDAEEMERVRPLLTWLDNMLQGR